LNPIKVRALSRWCVAGLLAAQAVACGEETSKTEIILVVDTDMAVPDELDSVDVLYTDPRGYTTTTSHEVATPDSWPVVQSLVLEGTLLEPYTIQVVGRRRSIGRIDRYAVGSFVEGQTVVLTVHLLKDCLFRNCPLNETCGETGCQSYNIDSDEYEPWTGTPPRVGDGGGGGDAGPDAGPDAGEDTGPFPLPDGSPDSTADTGPDGTADTGLDSGADGTATDTGTTPTDATTDGGCAVADETTCSGTTLMLCVAGSWEVDEECTIGCSGTPARCEMVLPTNLDQTVFEESGAVVIASNYTIDTDACSASSLSAPRPTVVSGFSGLCVLAMDSLVVNAGATLRAEGSQPLVLAAATTIEVAGTIDVSALGSQAGAGGSAGGAADTDAAGSCGGGAGGAQANDAAGGGGGGHSGAGGAGGSTGRVSPGGTAGTAVTGANAVSLEPLRGGCGGGGGGGGDSTGGVGGGGGGALALVANEEVVIESTGIIRANGAGGAAGGASGGGGGGGAGGAVLIEAVVVQIDGTLVAKGGGGGGADSGGGGADGGDDAAAATGGTSGDGAGGNGAAAAAVNGTAAPGATDYGGGGGGAAGRLRINTLSASATVDASAVVSPPLTSSGASTGTVATN
jgi:hypothetical protein